jgi:hypothetical protein
MPHLVIASRSPIPGAVLLRGIERGFISRFSPQKGNEEQASDCGSAPASLTELAVQYAFGVRAGQAVRAHVSHSSCPPGKHLSLGFAVAAKSKRKFKTLTETIDCWRRHYRFAKRSTDKTWLRDERDTMTKISVLGDWQSVARLGCLL